MANFESYGAGFFNVETAEGERMTQAHTLESVALAERNVGAFGPEGLTPQVDERIAAANAQGEYIKVASKRWICIDGRLTEEQWQKRIDNPEADPQIAGGFTGTKVAANMQVNLQPKSLSFQFAEETSITTGNGLEILVHGDAAAQESGCAAIAKMRDVLEFAAANVDIVAPLAWRTFQYLNAEEIISDADVALVEPGDAVALVVAGHTAADNDKLWDATPAQLADISVANGATYFELAHKHPETRTRLIVSEGAHDKANFVHDFSTDERTISQFAIALGEFAKETLRQGDILGRSHHDSMLIILAAANFNVSADMVLSSKNAKLDIIGTTPLEA